MIGGQREAGGWQTKFDSGATDLLRALTSYRGSQSLLLATDLHEQGLWFQSCFLTAQGCSQNEHLSIPFCV